MKEAIIVIPTYNEAGNIESLVRMIFKTVPDTNILVVDDNSPDGTANIVKKLQSQFKSLYLFSRPQKDGLGNAYKAGFKRVMSEFPQMKKVLMMDADLTHDPSYLPDLLENSKKFDFVVGSSHLNKEGMGNYPFKRVLLSRWANFYCRTIFGYKLRDWTNAFMVIDIDKLKKIDLDSLDTKEFAFVFNIRYRLLKNGCTWFEVPVIAKFREQGQSKMTLKTILEAAIAPWKIRFSKNGN